jgi:hypothetical protein
MQKQLVKGVTAGALKGSVSLLAHTAGVPAATLHPACEGPEEM